MKPDTTYIKKLLLHRLEKKGIGPKIIPGFIRDLTNSDFLDPHVNHLQISKRLQFLGWDDFELDYQTLQLAIACFETDGLKSFDSSLPNF